MVWDSKVCALVTSNTNDVRQYVDMLRRAKNCLRIIWLVSCCKERGACMFSVTRVMFLFDMPFHIIKIWLVFDDRVAETLWIMFCSYHLRNLWHKTYSSQEGCTSLKLSTSSLYIPYAKHFPVCASEFRLVHIHKLALHLMRLCLTLTTLQTEQATVQMYADADRCRPPEQPPIYGETKLF